MAFVSAGALTAGTTTVQPTAPASIVAGNLLLACVTSHCTTASTLSGSTTGWSLIAGVYPGPNVQVCEMWAKTAVGSDTMPTWNFSGGTQSAVDVSQFSGTVTLDQFGTNSGSASPLTTSCSGTDGGTGRLIVTIRNIRATVAGTITAETDNVNALGVGTGINVLATNATTSQADHHRSLYVTTATTGSSADNDVTTWTLSTGSTNYSSMVIASFKAGATEMSSLQPGWVFPRATAAQTYSGTLAPLAQWVAAVLVYTSATVPAQVTGAAGTAGNVQVALNWNSPANGGTPITSYTVTPYITGTPQTPITSIAVGDYSAATGTPYTVSPLVNGTTYTFTVTALNMLGAGAASAQSAGVTPAGSTVPSTPAAPAVVAGNATCQVTVTPPANGGSTILSYTFFCYQSTSLVAQQTQAGTTYSFPDLSNGTTYGFSVLATNVNGNSGTSTQTMATPQAPPGAGGMVLLPVTVNAQQSAIW
jgi:hypothetical protein